MELSPVPIGIMAVAVLAVSITATFLAWKHSPYIHAYIMRYLNDE